MNVVHIAWNEGLSAVYPSQVLRPMSLVAEGAGARIRLVAGSPVGELLRRPGRLAWRARQAMAEQACGTKITRVLSAPARLRRLVPEGVIASRMLHGLIVPGEPVILHCRGRAATELGLAVRTSHPGARVVFDCRGWEGPELLHAHGFADEEGAPADLLARAAEAETRQRHAALAADAVIVVSSAMRQVAVRQWGVQEARLSVVPCCADTGARPAELRKATRARLGFDGRFIVVYCGSLARYQAIEASLDAFEVIREYRGDALFFGITPSPDRLRSLLRDRGVRDGDYCVTSASHSEVPGLLAAGDLALLLRERSKVNEVASPVKFAEYLAAGLPVLISEGVGDYSDLVRRRDIGCVLDKPGLGGGCPAPLQRFLEDYAVSIEAVRGRCRAVAERELSAGRAADTLAELYGALWRGLSAEADGERPVVAMQQAAA